MSERRVLPPRTNRGRRPPPTQEEKARDDVLYDQLFERANTQSQEQQKKQRQYKVQQRIDTAQLQFQYKQMSGTNRIFFPYSRNYHYFFDLADFPRLQDSHSYAVDEKNVFNFTYSQQNKVLRDNFTVGQLFNRKYFGLPFCDNLHPAAKTRDKNICHGYLFQNEDRKFQLDRSIEELKQILNNYQKLEKNGKISYFSCLRKDIDLISILDDDLGIQQKKSILKRKIKILSEKKDNMKNFLQLEDKNFYYHSLNQRLHNEIEEKTDYISYQFITSEMQLSNHSRQLLQTCNEEQKLSRASSFFSYVCCDSLKSCLSEAALEKIVHKMGDSFFAKDEKDQFYQITSPFAFLSFTNGNIMTTCEKVLALRLAYQNEASFYVCKIFWKRAFGRDLLINKEMKHFSRVDYEKALSGSLVQLQRWRKQQKNNPNNESLIYPQLDSIINWQVFTKDSKVFDLFPLSNSVEVNIRQYVCIMLYQHLYLCISQICQFIMGNDIFSELIASQYYSKAHNYVVQCIGTARIGLLDEVLKKISQWIVRADIQTGFKILWVYNDKLGVGYFVKTSSQPEWETEKEDQDDVEEQDGNSDLVNKKVK